MFSMLPRTVNLKVLSAGLIRPAFTVVALVSFQSTVGETQLQTYRTEAVVGKEQKDDFF